jgi:hypothetical protein
MSELTPEQREAQQVAEDYFRVMTERDNYRHDVARLERERDAARADLKAMQADRDHYYGAAEASAQCAANYARELERLRERVLVVDKVRSMTGDATNFDKIDGARLWWHAIDRLTEWANAPAATPPAPAPAHEE